MTVYHLKFQNHVERWDGEDDGDFDDDDIEPGDLLPHKQVPNKQCPGKNTANIFIGGAGDESDNHNVLNSRSLRNDLPGKNYYATNQDIDKINAQIAALPPDMQVNLIGHSWGGATAAQAALANSDRIDMLVTIDPVSIFRPDFEALASSVDSWVNVNAAERPDSSPFSLGNLVAGLGGAWNDAPAKFADMHVLAPYDHHEFDNMMRAPAANGKTPLGMLMQNICK